METRPLIETLKRGPRRSVVVERAGGSEVVVKRFHHPHRLRALRDGARARAEFHALASLHRLGVRVPHPLELGRSPAGWEVRMERIPGAVSLETLLLGRQAPPGGWELLMARMGRLLAGLHRARVEHPDLHRGNVLVDAEGRPWLIDFHQARLRRRAPSGACLVDDLVAATAAAREVLPARTRVRFALAWRAALPAELAATIGTASELDEVERRGRLHRRATVAHGVGRWLRESSRVRLLRSGERRLLVRRDLPADAPEADGLLDCGTVPPSEARARWLGAARLHEHGLPVPRPAVLELGRHEARASFELPPGGDTHDASERELGALLGLLHDRGLDLERLGPADVLVTTSGVLFSPPTALGRIDPLKAAGDRFRAVRETLGPSPPEAFLEGYLTAFADRPRERERVAAAIGITTEAPARARTRAPADAAAQPDSDPDRSSDSPAGAPRARES